MKKNILIFIMAVASVQMLPAQAYNRTDYRAARNKTWWFDLQLAQHIGLNNWNDISYGTDGIPVASVTELRGALNFYMASKVFGGFIDMGLGVMPPPNMKSFDLDRMPMPNKGTRYYMREMISSSGTEKASAHFKFTVGLFGDFQINDRLNIMPYFGVGGMTMSRRSYEMILKEEGSNMQYKTKYVWGLNSVEDYESNGQTLGYLTGRLNFRYITNPKLNLLFGLEYTYFFSKINFYAEYTNTFNANVHRETTIAGNNMNMLGISVGISFR